MLSYHFAPWEETVDVKYIPPPVLLTVHVVQADRFEDGVVLKPLHVQLHHSQDEDISRSQSEKNSGRNNETLTGRKKGICC